MVSTKPKTKRPAHPNAKAGTGKPPKKPTREKTAKATPDGPKRWRVPLVGGVQKVGSDSFHLELKGAMHVHADTAKDAQEIADLILEKLRERGEGHGMSEPIEIETRTPLQAGPGDVESLADFEGPVEIEVDGATVTIDPDEASRAVEKLDTGTEPESSTVVTPAPGEAKPRFAQDVEP